MNSSTKVCLLGCVLLLLCAAGRGNEDDEEEKGAGFDELGGVSIKVFRGPSRTNGQEVFAPFGYHVKMPVGGSHKRRAPAQDSGEEEETNDEEGFEGIEFPDDD